MRKMSFKRKLLEILIQIALLPIAAITTAFTIYFLTIIGFIFGYVGYAIERGVLLWLKEYAANEYTYYVEPSDTVSVHEKSSGEYEVEVSHDDGERTETDSKIGVMAFFAFPLRIITLVLSIVALFIPSLNIKAKNNIGSFKSFVFDII